METRAHFIIVGAFIIAAFVLGFAFILWGVGTTSETDDVPYDIMFQKNVNGLSISNPVLLNGVRVGKVTNIVLNPDKPEEIRVRILVKRGTPIRDDSRAKLIPIGITGQSSVFISGGTASSPLLRPLFKGNVPVIKTVPSPLSEIMSALPEMLNTGKNLLEDLRKVVNEDNRKNIKEFLANISSFSNMLVKSEADIRLALDNIKNAAEQTRQAMTKTENAATTVNDYVAKELSPATDKIGLLVKRIDNLVKNMEPGLTRFSNGGLDDLTSLVNESRTLVEALENIAQKLDSNPKQYLLGKTVPEYQTP
ncbi:MlaD family protein [Halodesulfovibrio marinisediminis]|uniref:Phospholipid/cholesterol/gamma-HCH transport system substrate-binding protein n=1 Tax=Halodesulfovibrio marinisediminis DSM 17456 TaxID=1121457 RepID=A0A1N6DL26_9BACT|nr:MlaD family protein [Halodesulfovibrio marinisediminis]SIN71384.1 phospholipid/cholesterol/gamma-HCH transport system substrate-binding protein [Halodesulfovibrio marinisediminis DSM 17456]